MLLAVLPVLRVSLSVCALVLAATARGAVTLTPGTDATALTRIGGQVTALGSVFAHRSLEGAKPLLDPKHFARGFSPALQDSDTPIVSAGNPHVIFTHEAAARGGDFAEASGTSLVSSLGNVSFFPVPPSDNAVSASLPRIAPLPIAGSALAGSALFAPDALTFNMSLSGAAGFHPGDPMQTLQDVPVLNPVTIPEPTTVVLLGAGSFGLFLARRRLRRSSS